MLKRQEYIQDITTKLATLAHKVELNSSLNLTDINIHAEYFFCGLLNIIYDLSLTNLNSLKINAKSIDLIDIENKMAIQVTSTSELFKIKKTIDGFIETENVKKIDRLIVLILTKKKKYKSESYGKEFIISLKDDVIDYTDLVKKIAALPPAKLQKVHGYLSSEMQGEKSQRVPKEVNTLLGMIKILSSEDHPMCGNGFLEEPDPNGKINMRFSAYRDYLMEIYVSLMSIYAGILTEISNSNDTGTLNINKLSAYLKRYSNAVLDESNGDPVSALNKMTEYYSSRLLAEGIEYDDAAIQYYLIENMIRCNVFPNKVAVSC